MKRLTIFLERALFLSLFMCLTIGSTAIKASAEEEEAPTPAMLKAQLFRAVQGFGGVKKVQELITQGADPNAKDNYNRTVLMKAVKSRKGKMADVLIKAGADVNVRDDMGKTAIMKAALMGDDGMVELLKKAGAELSEEDAATVKGILEEEAATKDRQERLREAKKIADKIKSDLQKQVNTIAAEQEAIGKKAEEERAKEKEAAEKEGAEAKE
jgi:ankyrin repeat protein